MDKDRLGQLIRFKAHCLDMLRKCENRGNDQGREVCEVLKALLQKWRDQGYEFGPDKVWAEEMIAIFERWSRGTEKIISRLEEERFVSDRSDLFSVIRERRSVRFWQKRVVPREKIERVIEAALYAPSSFNRMTWKFFVVENALESIAEGDSSNESMIRKAPVRIYVGIDERLYDEKYAAALDAGLALQNLLLAAHALGLGGCLVYQCEITDQDVLKRYLDIPEYYYIYGVVLLGFPGEKSQTPARVNVDEASVFIQAQPGIPTFLK